MQSHFHGLVRAALITLLAGTLAACAQPKVLSWHKVGANQEDFNKDKYECLKDSYAAGGATTRYNPYAGTSSSDRTANMPLFKTCMEAKGYREIYAEGISASSVSGLQAARDQVNRAGEQICANPKFAAIYLNAPCNVGKATPQQLSDPTKITAAQKAIFPEWRAEVDKVVELWIAAEKPYVPASYEALYRKTYIPQFESLEQMLYTGQITWGQYTTRRREIAADYAAASAKLR